MATNTMTVTVTGRETIGCAPTHEIEAGMVNARPAATVIDAMIDATTMTTSVRTIVPATIDCHIERRNSMKKMKALLFAGLVAATALSALMPGAAQARPHKVCHFDHHGHRACEWVR